MEKGFSRPIVIIIIVAVIISGGFLLYKIYNYSREKIFVPEKNQDFSKFNKDDLLHKLFPNVAFLNGVANLPDDSSYESLRFYLKDSVEDYFTNSQEKELLLIANIEGVSHVGGLFHAYLGLFNKDGDLLTPSSPFGDKSLNISNGGYNFYNDRSQFGGDQGEFNFYNCKGLKYILFTAHYCPNGSCCNGTAILYNISNGQFEEIQKINQEFLSVNEKRNLMTLFTPVANADGGLYASYKLIPSADKITVKKVPSQSGNGSVACPETDYKVLNWNSSNCRFE